MYFFPFLWYRLLDPYILVCALPSVCRLLSETYGYSEVMGGKRVAAEFLRFEQLFKVKFCLYVDALIKKNHF